MLKIDWIQKSVHHENYRYSRHGDQERQNDNLALMEVHQALLKGRILEQYPDTGRGASCLVAGFTDSGIPIHIVCGCMGNFGNHHKCRQNLKIPLNEVNRHA